MSEMLAAVVTLPTLGVALLVWGFAPGFVNRIVARMYPYSDPRRRDMVAELYAVPRWEQPFWVLQQVERAISEGVPARLRHREQLRRKSFLTWRWVRGLREDGYRGVRLSLRPRGARTDITIVEVTHISRRDVSYLTEDGQQGTIRTGDVFARGSRAEIEFYSGDTQIRLEIREDNVRFGEME